MTASPTIPKHPALPPAEDYAWLRAKGLKHIQRLGSRLWTDYNVHDPGITLLELLCYALTDLGYRSSLPMADLLAARPPAVLDRKRQGFFTAREILTMSPLTVRDYRKLLIDRPGVRNAWLQLPGAGSADVPLYADCARSQLQYLPPTAEPVTIKGLYDVLLELEEVAGSGSVNSGKVFYTFTFDGGQASALIELRLPSWQALEANAALYQDLRGPRSALIPSGGADKAVTVQFISGNKADNQDVNAADQAQALRTVLYATMRLEILKDRTDAASTATLTLADVPMRVWFKSDAHRKALKLPELKAAMEDPSPGGLLGKYLEMIHQADAVIADARQTLQDHRNLGEDWRRVQTVAVEDVAICADFELDPAADIEAVTAEAYHRIARYLNPEIRFRTLAELLDAEVPVEQIFDGPRLDHGFLDDAEVDASNLRRVLYASDLYNELMDIAGVLSIRNFSMAGYDQEGRQSGQAARWELPVTAGHQPRFYPQASKFLFFKNGLPFLPDASELHDLLQVIQGQSGSPKALAAENDLAVPAGTWLPLQDYHPVQYQLPLTYGVGLEGLPGNASVERVAQARQLKAYLLFFEQRLVDYLAQLANVSECFAIDAGVKRTYFTRLLGDGDIRDVEEELYAGLDQSKLERLAESPAQFRDRRNRFLDHLLARFAESFADYALVLYRIEKDKVAAREQLIGKKIDFLRALPEMTHDRAKAFDYTQPAPPCTPAATNVAGLEVRLRGLLGLQSSDRLFLVEHLLLRPRQVDVDPLLPICTEPDCQACGGQDPYSFRLSVILARTSVSADGEMDWRRYAEKVVRTEVPAHLLARICWVAPERLAAFETAWCAWLGALAQVPPDPAAQTAALADLLKELAQLKNVYPPATLHDCLDSKNENRVLLDRSVITSPPQQ